MNSDDKDGRRKDDGRLLCPQRDGLVEERSHT